MTSDTIATLVVWVALAIVCMEMARNRGRNPNLGIAAGLAFGIIAVIYYWIAGDTKELREQKLLAKIGKEKKC